MIHFLGRTTPFPPLEFALREPDGLLCAGADLSVGRLVDAYRQGIFPWFSEGEPILWWSPDPRMVLFADELHISRSLRRRLNSDRFDVRTDTVFRQVMERCAAPRNGVEGTWILPVMIEAYCALHDSGYAHSVEVWANDELAGGIYGVQVGRMFFAESMFHSVSDASKVALVHLMWQLKRMGIPLMDCQQETRHVASMGARLVPRSEFTRILKKLVGGTPTGLWSMGSDTPL